jgi:hypothetical protein
MFWLSRWTSSAITCAERIAIRRPLHTQLHKMNCLLFPVTRMTTTSSQTLPLSVEPEYQSLPPTTRATTTKLSSMQPL